MFEDRVKSILDCLQRRAQYISTFPATFFIVAVVAVPALSATFTVTNTNDSGPGSLREAITQANVNMALDTIEFNVPSGDPNCAVVPGHGTVCTISLSTQVDVVFPVIVNGYTQPGASANTNPITMGSNAVLLIEIRSSNPPGSENSGLVFGSSGSGSTVRGLVMNRLAIAIQFLGNDNSTIEGNFIGTNAAGTVALPNTTAGIRISSSADNNIVGGTSNSARNVISGNTSSIGVQITINCAGNTVQGNFIGTNAAGNAALGNATGVSIENNSPNTLVGGDMVPARNVIVPSLQGGAVNISNTHSGVQVRGNFIGTDLTGTIRLENSSRGVDMLVTTGVTVGGLTAALGMPPGNLIASGNFGIGGQSTHSLTVQGNLIGTDTLGNLLSYPVPPLGGNTYGISLHDATALIGGTTPGQANVIAGHTDAGVKSTFGGQITTAILGNSIHSNGRVGGPSGLGIDLAITGVSSNDPCDVVHPQNFPVITNILAAQGLVSISGTLNSVANKTFRLEFFSNTVTDPSGFGEGKTFLGSANVTTDGTCNAAFSSLIFNLPSGESFITATATRLDAMMVPIETSEFSAVQMTPTAANVTIAGRVLTANGLPVYRANLVLTDAKGMAYSSISNAFGYFRFDDIAVGQTYILSASAKGTRFAPRVIVVTEEIADLEMIGVP
jgi:hypothetical protein